MLNKILSKSGSFYYQYLKGWKTNEKIIVFESDDWGTERIPSYKVREELLGKGIDVYKNPFTRFDTLENSDDLNALIKVSNDLELKYGKRPIITSNTIMANPDFSKIEETGFNEYHFETFEKTYFHKYKSLTTFDLFNEAIEKNVIKPQFHGREHVQVLPWLKALSNEDRDLLESFKKGVFGIELREKITSHSNLMSAWNYQTEFEKRFVLDSIVQGLNIFEKIFSKRSQTIIAPVGIWSEEIEKTLFSNGVQGIQSFVFQKHPDIETTNRTWRYTGQNNEEGIIYTVRNCYFEPSTNKSINWIDKCFRQIERAFLFKKPAIISMHRINFVGGIDIRNRDYGIENYKSLVEKICERWKDVQFLSSEQLNSKVLKEQKDF